MRRILFSALLLGVLPAAASAQLSVGAGPAFPTGDFGDAYDTGLHLQASVNVPLPMLPDIRIDGMYQRYSGDVADADILGGGVNVLFDLPLVAIKPYLLAGVGYYDVSLEAAGLEGSDSEVGFTGGAGVRVGVGRFGVFGEARALRIGGDVDLTTIPVIIGVTF